MPQKSINAKQINGLLTELRAAYAGVRLKAEDEDALPRVWLEALNGQDHAAVKQAVAQHIRTSRYWPSPAEIIKLVDENKPEPVPEPYEPGHPIVDAVVAITGGIGASSADYWFKDTEFVDVGGMVELRVQTEFRASWIKSHYGYLLDAIAAKALGRAVRVRVRSREKVA